MKPIYSVIKVARAHCAKEQMCKYSSGFTDQ